MDEGFERFTIISFIGIVIHIMQLTAAIHRRAQSRSMWALLVLLTLPALAGLLISLTTFAHAANYPLSQVYTCEFGSCSEAIRDRYVRARGFPTPFYTQGYVDGNNTPVTTYDTGCISTCVNLDGSPYRPDPKNYKPIETAALGSTVDMRSGFHVASFVYNAGLWFLLGEFIFIPLYIFGLRRFT